jgi:WD40 repeat protein
VHRFKLHKVHIQSLSFSKDEKYLASLGGQDDNNLVIWEVSFSFIASWLRAVPLAPCTSGEPSRKN